MPSRTIAIGADHAGYELKTRLKERLSGLGYEALDLDTHDSKSVDCPDFARALAAALKQGEAARGVLVCGSGIGTSIAADRHKHVRVALLHSVEAACLARRHNEANVLALGARLIDPGIAEDALVVFLSTPFEEDRHLRRVAMLG